jgi:Protein of unknown function (DUF3822)
MPLLANFKISDERFSVENIDNHDLIFEISKTRIRFFIKNKQAETIIWLEDYFIGLENELEEIEAKISEIIKNHIFLAANFWNSIKVVINTPFFGLIPTSHFKESLQSKYLGIYFPKVDFKNFSFNSHFLESSQTHFVYAYPTVFLKAIEGFYEEKKIDLSFSIFEISSHFKQKITLHNKNYIIIDDMFLYIFILETPKRGLSVDTIPIQSDNLKKYLEYYLKEGQIKSILLGEITPYSMLYNQIKSLGKAAEIGNLKSEAKLSQYFDEMPIHRYWPLFCY